MADNLRTDGKRIRAMSDKGRAWLVALEGGSKLKAYRDSIGIPTIGAGLTYIVGGKCGPRRVTMADRFADQHAAMGQFALQLKRYEAAVDAATRDDITQEHFDCFTSFCFNVGERAFSGSTLVKRFNAGAPLTVLVSELLRWNHAGGQVSPGLVNRRQCEADLLVYGCYRVQGGKVAA
jgi:lysozyme